MREAANESAGIALERVDQGLQPARLGHGVVVEQRDVGAVGDRDAVIDRRREAVVGRQRVPLGAVRLGDRPRAVERAAVDHEHARRRQRLRRHAVQAGAEQRLAIEVRDDEIDRGAHGPIMPCPAGGDCLGAVERRAAQRLERVLEADVQRGAEEGVARLAARGRRRRARRPRPPARAATRSGCGRPRAAARWRCLRGGCRVPEACGGERALDGTLCARTSGPSLRSLAHRFQACPANPRVPFNGRDRPLVDGRRARPRAARILGS